MTEADYLNAAGNATATIANLAGTFSTNLDNKKLMREQMRFNEKMFEAQKEYNWDMFNAVNQYNTPTAQLERFRAAGINPAMAMTNVNPAEAQGGSVSPPSAPAAPTLQAPNFDGLSRIAEVLYNSELRQEQLEAAQIANDRAREALNFEREDYLYKLNIDSNAVEEGKWRNNDWRDKSWFNTFTFKDRVDAQKYDTLNKAADFDLKQLQSIGVRISNMMDQLRLDNLPKELSAQLALLAAQKFAAMGQGSAGYAAAKSSIALAAKYGAEEYGQRISNRQADAIAGSAIFAAISENNAKTLRFENELQDQKDLKDFLFGNSFGQKFLRKGKQSLDLLSTPVRALFK